MTVEGMVAYSRGKGIEKLCDTDEDFASRKVKQ
jgi:hypothetical protein